MSTTPVIGATDAISGLPQEVQIKILRKLSLTEHETMACVSRYWNNLAKDKDVQSKFQGRMEGAKTLSGYLKYEEAGYGKMYAIRGIREEYSEAFNGECFRCFRCSPTNFFNRCRNVPKVEDDLDAIYLDLQKIKKGRTCCEFLIDSAVYVAVAAIALNYFGVL